MDFSGAGFFASLIVSTIGFSLFLYGKKQVRIPQLVIGLAMMAYPYFIDRAAITYGVAGALMGALWLATRMGW